MQISPRKKSKKTFIIISLIVILIAVGVLVFLQMQGNNDDSSSEPTTTSNSTGSNTTTSPNTNTQTQPTDNTSNNQTNVSNQVPTIETPSDDATFPIENSHYRISQGATKNSFDVVLYAVINNPSQYNEYIAQLKQYKKEANDYLTQRYGNSISITWSPEDARSL